MRRPRWLTLIALGLVVAAFAVLLLVSLPGALVYDVTPSELAARPLDQPVQLYGLVVAGSVHFDAATRTLTFEVTDGQTIDRVTTQSIPTDLFRDGIGVVLAGRLTAPGQFQADQLIVKHSEVYAPLAPGQTIPPGVLQELGGSQ
ncbi:MAG: cytochrome c maturation protein CcmE [Candidatus Limnocylindrales bacterium]